MQFFLDRMWTCFPVQDIADLAFRSSQGRPLVSLSFSVMVADTVISILVESIFLIQVRSKGRLFFLKHRQLGCGSAVGYSDFDVFFESDRDSLLFICIKLF
jgi:hypothetical protein